MTDRCEQCGDPVDTGCHLELEHPDAVGTAFLAQTLCETCADRVRALLAIIDERVTLALYWCPGCDWFDVAPVSGSLDCCGDCGTVLEEKPVTPSTVFRSMERTDARGIRP